MSKLENIMFFFIQVIVTIPTLSQNPEYKILIDLLSLKVTSGMV